MAILITAESAAVVPNRIALIDADVVAYYCSYGLDEYDTAAVETKLVQRCDQIEFETKAKYFRYYLSGKANFRETVARLKRYKGNRYDEAGNRIKPQPKHLPFARAWLQQHKSAQVSVDQEADDSISIAAATCRKQGKYETVISTVDKDLGINPGLFHNQMDNTVTLYSEFGEIHMQKDTLKGHGLKFFYAQLLMGDSTDWIPGLPKVSNWQVKEFNIRNGGCGPAAAFKTLDTADTEQECFCRVARAYQDYWSDKEYTDWRDPKTSIKADWYEMLLEQGQLLWMRREEGQMWSPKIELMEEYVKQELLLASKGKGDKLL